jgi:hypothetical protein
MPPDVAAAVKNALTLLPKPGDTAERPRPVSIPTDGTVYDPELAKCCSCEPERAQRADLDNQLIELEIERRKALIAAGDLGPFDPVPATAGTAVPAPTP